MYLDSSPTVKHLKPVAGPDGMNDETAKRVFVALKVLVAANHGYRLVTRLSVGRPVFGIYTWPITDSVFITPHEFMDDIHEPFMFFEE